MVMPKEIERKFLVLNPEEVLAQDYRIVTNTMTYQSYLATGNSEVRVRHTEMQDDNNQTIDHHYFLTIKHGLGLVRDELENRISQNTYYQISDLIPEKHISKRRKELSIEIDGVERLVEFDHYEDINTFIIEIEFPSEEEAEKFIPPSWFGKEVTEDKSYKAQNIWKALNNKK
ncbi:hypothetical protein P4V86_03295 [Brevibacillus laterosporus]|uniref:hypothetical protein n=1 Tax=Brevibacillus laterosporus TaxID=1465 RepID=UPI000371A5B8|nr:hypothetical protein [Brevibacillus laterosporus]ATO48549.1 hypothetical protein BrL25_05130 [Brevibacillus laterosporus DSM 25]MED2002383.1 hypothetical protein [Brevibacillus laterosporus]